MLTYVKITNIWFLYTDVCIYFTLKWWFFCCLNFSLKAEKNFASFWAILCLKILVQRKLHNIFIFSCTKHTFCNLFKKTLCISSILTLISIQLLCGMPSELGKSSMMSKNSKTFSVLSNNSHWILLLAGRAVIKERRSNVLCVSFYWVGILEKSSNWVVEVQPIPSNLIVFFTENQQEKRICDIILQSRKIGHFCEVQLEMSFRLWQHFKQFE